MNKKEFDIEKKDYFELKNLISLLEMFCGAQKSEQLKCINGYKLALQEKQDKLFKELEK